MELKDKALRIIEALVSDDLCESVVYPAVMDRPFKLSLEDMKVLANKLSTIYRITHAVREDAICYEAHDDWRKEINSLYQKYKRANLL